MKSKKKMLLALGAMSIAAIGAGSVSTFAWYQAAEAGGKAVSRTVNGDVVSSKPTYTATSVFMPIEVQVTRIKIDGSAYADPQPLELAHYYGTGQATSLAKSAYATEHTEDFTQADLYHAFYLGDGDDSLVYQRTTQTGYDKYARYVVSIRVPTFPSYASLDESGQAVEGTGGKYVKVGESTDPNNVQFQDSTGTKWTRDKVAEKLSTTGVKVSLTRNTDASNPSRAKFFGYATTDAAPSIANGDESKADQTAASISGIYASSHANDSYTPCFWFALYVEGENASHDTVTLGNPSVNGNFKVTVAPTGA